MRGNRSWMMLALVGLGLNGSVGATVVPGATPESDSARRIEKEYPVTSGQRLAVDLKSGGSLKITGWDREAVGLTIIRDGEDWNQVELNINPDDQGLRIESRMLGRWNHYDLDLDVSVQVPKRFSLELETMGGDIEIDGVDGHITGQTMGGGLNLSHLQGKIEMTTMGGKIRLTDSNLDGTVKTMGGQVLLQDVTGGVKGSSMGGTVTYKNVTLPSGKSTGQEVVITSMGGEIDVDDAPVGANVHTMGGDIQIRSAKDHVKAKTMGGDIDIDSVDGWVEATTMGGDMEVHVTGDPQQGRHDINLRSMGGDITVWVPDGLSMDVDITVNDTHRASSIVSDFELDIRNSSRTWGRDSVRGTGIIAGGKHKIRIETVKGRVTLKRAI